jgi:hypothetical protein
MFSSRLPRERNRGKPANAAAGQTRSQSRMSRRAAWAGSSGRFSSAERLRIGGDDLEMVRGSTLRPTFVNLLTVNLNEFGRGYAEANSFAADRHDTYPDIVVDHDNFTHTARQNEHGLPSLLRG